jgi:hypothetical protein
METMACLLPGGYVDADGVVHQQVDMAPLSGKEEELLASSYGLNRSVLVTSLLSRCIQRLGSISPVSDEVVRQLLVADRQYLLLKLREATFGELVQATIVCLNPSCTNKMDIDFSIQDIPVTASEDKGPRYSMQLSPAAAFRGHDDVPCRWIAFRLPNGADQECIAPILAQDEAAAADMLLARCIEEGGLAQPTGGLDMGWLSPLARMEIEQQMEAVAPHVELTMEGACPECGQEFTLPFDLERSFFRELRTSRDLLYREVHYLAYHYHWSEREIMEMPQSKRRKYIEVLAEEIERLNDAVR